MNPNVKSLKVVASDRRVWPSSSGHWSLEVSALLFQVLLSISLCRTVINTHRHVYPFGIPRAVFLDTWKRWPALEASFHAAPYSAATQGQRKSRLSCNFGFRDKCSLPCSGGTELLPAIKTLKSNSSLPRECNPLPPVIDAALVAAVLPAQPSHSPARMVYCCFSALTPVLRHTTPLLRQRCYWCICAMNWSREEVQLKNSLAGKHLVFCVSSSKLDQIPDPFHSRATNQYARRTQGPVHCRREDETSSRKRLEREYQKPELVLKT